MALHGNVDNQHSQGLSAPNGKIILKQCNNPRSTLEAVVIAESSLSLIAFAWLNREVCLITFHVI